MRTTVPTPEVIVLADGKNNGEVSHNKGHLFEQFMANLLALHGYIDPQIEDLNVTQNGIELDLALEARLSGQRAIAECKAYSTPLDAKTVTNFYGKLAAARLTAPDTVGFLIISPGLNGPASEKSAAIQGKDREFKVIRARDIWQLLEEKDQLKPVASAQPLSDPVILVHKQGIIAAAIETNPLDGRPSRVLINPTSVRSEDARELLSRHPYSQGLPVEWQDPLTKSPTVAIETHQTPTAFQVRGSSSDFEYQYPASPKFFVGRRQAAQEARAALLSHRVVVLNAQSGWGKSSLALKIAEDVKQSGGYAAVFDSRTASTGRYIPEVLRSAAVAAASAGILSLPIDASWASTKSAVDSLSRATFFDKEKRILVFFDQFENVFQSSELTREFRDLALAIDETDNPVCVGFAWKTDYVGWAEDHPYALRDQIRERAKVIALEPFSAREVEVILSRLQKAAGQPLSRELRTRLREHSAGLPWLLKKLSGHVISELQAGTSQENLVAEGLNVRSLFDADLAELSPAEQEALRHVAQNAPMPAGEALERFEAATMQALLDRRLLVQVGSKFDTYWDIFRDYIVTGRVPIEDTYILRQNTGSVSKLIAQTLGLGGDVPVPDLAKAGNTSEGVVFNVARDMRLLGLCTFSSNRVSLIPELIHAEDRESVAKSRVTSALRRHRAYRAFAEMAQDDDVTIDSKLFAEVLPELFPAVDVTDKTWTTYAQIFLKWFQYAGLAEPRNGGVGTPTENFCGRGTLTGARRGDHHRYGIPKFPSASPGVAVKLLETHANSIPKSATFSKGQLRALSDLVAIGALTPERDQYKIIEGLVSSNGRLEPEKLLSLLGAAPGGASCLRLLQANPKASQEVIGLEIQKAYGADWALGTVRQAGKFFRGYARAAGVDTGVRARRTERGPGHELLPLFKE